jgi:hypothetical protein
MQASRLLGIPAVCLALLIAASQAMALPAGAVAAKKTPGTPGPANPQHTPGPPFPPPGQEAVHEGVSGKSAHYRGTVVTIGANSLALNLADGSTLVFELGPETRVKVPGAENATLGSIQPGMQVSVHAKRQENGSLLARSVMMIPAKPRKTHRVGWITAYTPGVSVSIVAHDGTSYTFVLTGETRILPAERAASLAVGSRVTIIAPREPGSLGWTAHGLVVHPAGSGEGSLPAATATSTP